MFCSQLMFDEKQKRCVKRIHLVTDDGLYDGNAFYKVKIVFIHPLKVQNINGHQCIKLV